LAGLSNGVMIASRGLDGLGDPVDGDTTSRVGGGGSGGESANDAAQKDNVIRLLHAALLRRNGEVQNLRTAVVDLLNTHAHNEGSAAAHTEAPKRVATRGLPDDDNDRAAPRATPRQRARAPPPPLPRKPPSPSLRLYPVHIVPSELSVRVGLPEMVAVELTGGRLKVTGGEVCRFTPRSLVDVGVACDTCNVARLT
jgi:hypothetical protein